MKLFFSFFIRLWLVFIIPNLFAFLFAQFAGQQRDYIFNIDYIVIAAIFVILAIWSVSVARWAASLMFGFLMAIEGWTIASQVYFSDPMMVFDMLGFANYWPWRVLLPIGLGLVGIGLLLIRLLKEPLNFRYNVLAIVGLLAVLVVTDRIAARVTTTNMVSSGVATGIRPFINDWINQRNGIWHAPDPIDTDSMALRFQGHDVPPARILSVGVESLGVERDPAAQAKLIANLIDPLSGRYTVLEIGEHHYRGSTLEGEVRELCGLRLNGFPRTPEQLSTLSGCLPGRLKAAGWAVSGWHGNAAKFYRRDIIYPAVGLGFPNDFLALKSSVAAPCLILFVGICDKDVFRLALDWLAVRDRSFAHVMTLDGHLPSPRDAACGNDEVCLYRHYQQRTFASLGKALASRNQGPDIVYIYGDHAPPFLDARMREKFFPGVVPFIVLKRVGFEPQNSQHKW